MKSALPLALALLLVSTAAAQTDSPVITRAPVAADEKIAAPPASTPELDDLRTQNKKLSAELALAWKENDQLKSNALTQVAAANQKTEAAQNDLSTKSKETDALKIQLADAQKLLDELRKNTADPSALADAKADRDKLATDLLKANSEKSSLAAQLDSAQRDLSEQNQKLAALETERADLSQKLSQNQTSVASASDAESSELADLKSQAAQTEDKLNMSLRAYTTLQTEDDQLKDNLAKADDEKTSLAAQLDDARHQIADLAPKADDDAAARDQLRQTHNLAAQLASENSDLKTRLALASTGGAPVPAPTSIPAPTPAPAPQPPAVSPAAPPSTAPIATAAPAGPRTHKVVAGDTLAKISKQYYGTSSHWQQILDANHDKLHSDKNLQIGMDLKIP